MTKPSKKQIIDFIKVTVPYLIAFAISLTVGLLMYKAKKIAPFGDESILCMDLWGQYFPMYVQNKEASSLSDMFYSWNGAFGFNNWAQNAYYCNSVFLILFKFIPIEKLVSALNWICVFKIAFSSVTCLAFLKFKIKERNPVLIAGAVSYSLCAYMLAFYSQCMWTDSLIYVPLILIGLEKMLYGKKPLLYTLTLAITIISNFYIGFAICIFIVLYFICLAVPMITIYENEQSKWRIGGFKLLGMSIVKFGVFSILAGAISAVIVFPIGKAVSNTVASETAFPETVKWYADITAYLQLLFPESKLCLEYSGANIFTTILVFIMTPLYLFNNSIKISERITNLIVLVFLFASLNCNVLDFIWHGLHFPNQLPARWSFLISLMLVYMCCKGVSHIRELPPSNALVGLASGLLIFMYVKDGHGEQPEVEVAGKYVAFLVVSAIIIMLASIFAYIGKKLEQRVCKAENNMTEKADGDNKDNKKNTAPVIDVEKTKKAIAVMNVAVICCMTVLSGIQVYDSGSNFVKVATLEQGGLPISNGVSYASNVEKHVTNGKKWKSGNDDFYRCVAHSGFTFNPSMVGGYHGMGYYSSTLQGSVFRFLRFLGNRVYAENLSTIYNDSSPIQNSLFGVKYVLDYSHSYGYYTSDFNFVSDGEALNLWENPTALSIAYATSDNIKDWHVKDELRPLHNQITLLESIYGEQTNAFSPIDVTELSADNATFLESESWNDNYYVTTDTAFPAVIYYDYTIEQDGYYYMEHNFRAGNVKAEWDDRTKDIDLWGERFAYLGEMHAGTTVRITATVENVTIGCCGVNMYRFDKEEMNNICKKISEQQLDVTKFKATKITGNIHKESDGLVMATIAQDGGWSAYCDGEKLDTTIVADTFLAFEVPSGEHQITLKYRVPGFSAGLIVTLFGLVVTFILSFPELFSKYLPKRKKKTDKTETEETETTTETPTETEVNSETENSQGDGDTCDI